jgi:mono/diheme cytochrome c family protein
VFEVPSLLALAAATAQQEAAPGGGFGIGAFVLILTIVALLVWMAYLFINSRRSRAATTEPSPLNQSPYMSDDELENVRTTRVLRAAVIAAAALAVILPWYAFNEADRTAAATERVAQLDIDEGEKWFHDFLCFQCHGEDLGGGAAEFAEPRSGVLTTWLVPSLNDVFYRYSEDEVRYVIEYGRQGTPMPANGLAGGGSMTDSEIDQLLAFIQANQVPQAEAVAKADRNVDLALGRIDSGEEATQILINKQQARIDAVERSTEVLAVAGDLENEVLDLLGGAGTCTPASAELALTTCDEPGLDTDRDGITDAAEAQLTEIARIANENLTTLGFNADGTANPLPKTVDGRQIYDVSYDATNAFTNSVDGLPVADLDTAEQMLSALRNDLLLVGITADKKADFLKPLLSGLDFLENSAETQPWMVDFAEVGTAMSDVAGRPISEDEAKRAVGLFNGYCARCHSGGFSAGSSFEVGPGTGAWGPAINDGREAVQFPNLDDHRNFIIDGTDNAVHYGVNGIGTGRMPGFGTSLSKDDIDLIALYERTL